MERRFCKVCGCVSAGGEAECPECGAPLLPLAEEEPPVPEQIDIIPKPREKTPRARHPRLRLAAGFLAVSLLLQGIGLWRTARSEPEGWSYLWLDNDGGELVTPQGIWTPEDGASIDPSGSANVLGAGRVFSVRPKGKIIYGMEEVPADLYYYDGQTVTRTDWLDAVLSPDGRTLFYIAQDADGQQTLTRRDERTGREIELDRGGALRAVTADLAGDALVYGKDDAMRLWRRAAGESRETDAYAFFLGRDGVNAAVIEPGLENGEADDWAFAVHWGGRGETTVLGNGCFLCDRDLTEVLYQDADGLWRYENEKGETAQLTGLPDSYLDPLRSQQDRVISLAALFPPRLTGWVYQAGDRLYCIDRDLTVTELTGGAVARETAIDPQGTRLYYVTDEAGRAEDALFRVDEPLTPKRRTTRLLEEYDVQEIKVSPDGDTLCALVRDTDNDELKWMISTGGGEFQSLDSPATESCPGWWGSNVYPVDSGGCWFLKGGWVTDGALFYRSPEGQTRRALDWSSPASSVFVPEDPETVRLPGLPSVEDAFLTRVADDRLLLRLEFRDDEAPTRYWVLDGAGNLEELERLEVAE